MALSKKVRRNSGRRIVQDDEGYTIYWDDWIDWRDGFRQPFDNTKIRHEFCMWNDFLEVPKYNKKLKRLCERRKLMMNTRNSVMI